MTAAAAVGREGGRLHQRRHHRVPARRRRLVLLPRDEHAPAGRASDHRDGDRRRSGAVADPHRARRAARSRSGGAAQPEGARHRVPHLRGGSRQRLPAVAGPHPGAARAAGTGRARRQRRLRRRRGADLLRPDDLEADHLGRRRATHALARMRRALAEYEVRGIRTTIPFFRWILDDEDFKAATVRHQLHRSQARQQQGRCMADRRRRTKIWRRLPRRCICSRKPVANGAAAGRGREPLARRRPARKRCDDFRGRDRRRAPHGRHRAARAALLHVDARRPRAHRRRAAHQRRGRCRCSCSATARGTVTSVDAVDVALASTATSAATSTCTSTAGPSRCRSARPARSGVRTRQAPARRRPGPQRVTAPMPGKVVRVLVEPGDEVKAAPGPGRRRSDEDGERAARGSRRPRARGRRRRRPVGRRRRRAAGRGVARSTMTEVSPPEPSRVRRARTAVGAAGRTAYRYARRFAVTIGVIVAVVAGVDADASISVPRSRRAPSARAASGSSAR